MSFLSGLMRDEHYQREEPRAADAVAAAEP